MGDVIPFHIPERSFKRMACCSECAQRDQYIKLGLIALGALVLVYLLS